MVVESEWASVLRILGRDGNNLSPTIRQAWDTGDLNTMTKNNPARATGAHISIVGHITLEELRRYLDRTEMGNGFANRHLFACVKRSKCLPEGGCIDNIDFVPIQKKLQAAIDFSRKKQRLNWDEEARKLWCDIYPELSEAKPSLFGTIVARAEAQVVRLATIYALLDCSAFIRKEHLEAALALWKFCEDSAQYVFGDSLGDPVADEILNLLRANEKAGVTRTQIRDHFGRHKTADIDKALRMLQAAGIARLQKEETEGRPLERWFVVTTAT
jgi:DNA replicative helicase MCM subunit Mcm2 (Cdc46/Mcm family)